MTIEDIVVVIIILCPCVSQRLISQNIGTSILCGREILVNVGVPVHLS